jgi:hypothetical protein
VLIMRGEHAPLPTRVVSERLIEILPQSRLKIIAGAGHMGPLTHAAEVSQRILQHISAVQANKRDVATRRTNSGVKRCAKSLTACP